MSKRASEWDFLLSVLRGDESAAQFCTMLFRISQVLDDLVDGDKPVTKDAIYFSFWEALINLPSNDFFRRHNMFLSPLMASALQDWRDSVTLEQRADYHARSIAFVLRDQLSGLVVQCAGLVGGFVWMQQVSAEIRDYFHDEQLSAYLMGLESTEGAQ